MEVIRYTEYTETIKPEEEDIGVTVQVPENSDTDPEWPIHIIIQAGSRVLRFTLKEFEGVSDVIRKALSEAGWVEKGEETS